MFVSNLAYAVDRGIAREMAPYDLAPLDVHLLTICRDMEECTATQLAQMLPVDAARISRLVNGLVEKGLLIRRRPRTDRRVVLLRLSEDGERLAAEVAQQLAECYAGLTAGLDQSEIDAFATAAMRIITNHRAMTPP